MTVQPSCSAQGCDRKHYGLSLCHMHYQRQKKGLPFDAPSPASQGAGWQFLLDAMKSSTDECIEWPFGKYVAGYGQARNPETKKKIYSHSAICELKYGPRPASCVACHSCDNPSCVNPRHLRWDTQKANVQEAIARGRAKIRERHPMAKLSWSEVREILASNDNAEVLSARYSVKPQQIKKIRQRRQWKDVA